MFDFFIEHANSVGIAGVIILLIAYFAISTGKMSANTISYHFFNGIAGLMLLFSLYFEWNTPAVIMESLWVLISLIGMVRVTRMKGKV